LPIVIAGPVLCLAEQRQDGLLGAKCDVLLECGGPGLPLGAMVALLCWASSKRRSSMARSLGTASCVQGYTESVSSIFMGIVVSYCLLSRRGPN
jgi:hypothetical protein